MPDENSPLPQKVQSPAPVARRATPAAELEALKPYGGQTGGNGAPSDPTRPGNVPLDQEHTGLTSVVGIGASAGGVSVLQEFFGMMPPDSGLSFVVVMHLLPDHES